MHGFGDNHEPSSKQSEARQATTTQETEALCEQIVPERSLFSMRTIYFDTLLLLCFPFKKIRQVRNVIKSIGY